MSGQHKEQDKQTAILLATLDLIAEQGFHGAPVSQIAKHSGVSTGIIYHYFDNKESLIHALYHHIKNRFSEALLAGEPQSMPFQQGFKQIWLNAYSFFVSYPKEANFLEQYENSPYFATSPEIYRNENIQTLETLIQQYMESGAIRPMDFAVLYELTLGVAVGLAKRTLAGTILLDAQHLEEIAVACCRAVET